jgi:hypothetical protein
MTALAVTHTLEENIELGHRRGSCEFKSLLRSKKPAAVGNGVDEDRSRLDAMIAQMARRAAARGGTADFFTDEAAYA